MTDPLQILREENAKLELRLVLQRTTDLTTGFDDGLEQAIEVIKHLPYPTNFSDGELNIYAYALDHAKEAIRALKGASNV